MPLGGSPPLESGAQNHRWPTSGQCGYITHASWGVPTASERGAESQVAHKWARWLHNPCRLGGPHRFRAGGRITGRLQVGKVVIEPLPHGGSLSLQRGGQNHRWPTTGQGGYVSPAASGSTPLQSGGQNQRWHTTGQGGYVTPAAWGVPTASERGAESQVAHKWARWLRNPCGLGVPHRFGAWGTITGNPQVGKVAT